MITNAFIIIFITIVGILGNLLPGMDALPAGLQNAFDWIFSFIRNLMYVIPSGEVLLTIFSLVISIETGIFIFNSINWALNLIRGSGAK